MASPLRIAADPALAESLHGLERSVRVGTAAAMLDADQSHVRKLLKAGELDGHTLGKRGVRIFVSSIEAYRERGRIANDNGAREPRRVKTVKPSAELQEALAFLQAAGVLAQPANSSNVARGRRK